jgi:hypothetical protein
MQRIISSITPEVSQVEHQFTILEQELATGTADSPQRDELMPGGSRRQSQLAELIGQKQEPCSHGKKGWPLHHTISWLVL